ncbi:UNVERIFIED_CONTAM: hypothetical protein FKN15_028392 [Acipenser sinensis]
MTGFYPCDFCKVCQVRISTGGALPAWGQSMPKSMPKVYVSQLYRARSVHSARAACCLSTLLEVAASSVLCLLSLGTELCARGRSPRNKPSSLSSSSPSPRKRKKSHQSKRSADSGPPFPIRAAEPEKLVCDVQYQMEMMRSLRHVNIDHLHVGWYQSTYYGSFVSRALLDSQFSYQHAIEESVVLVYDPIKTAQGSLSLKAYRLTPKLMEICKEKDFTPEGLKKASIGFENMFEEVPIVIKNSHLINVLMWEMEQKSAVSDKQELLNLSSRLKKASIGFENMFEEVPIVIKNSHLINVLMWEMEQKSAVSDKQELLNLSSSNHLEKSLQLLMDRVDDMSQDIVKYNTFSRNVSKQQQQKHQYVQRRQQENTQRQTRGEPPLPEEDISKMFKPPQPPSRMDTLLIAGQINTYCQHIKEFTSQNLGKMFMAEALQGHNV